jgi:LuxR family transcriptional regulator, maltose regulon positive regulatory protein
VERPLSLPHWVGELASGLAGTACDAMDSSDDLRLHARLTGALLAQAPDSPCLAAAAERALRLMPMVDDVAARLAAAPHLLHYCEWCGQLTQANALVAGLARVLDDAAVGPAQLVHWYGEVARWYNRNGEHGQAQRSAGVARRIVTQSRLDGTQLQTLEIAHLLRSADLPAARARIDSLRAALPDDATRALADCGALDAHWHALSGDVDSAIRAARSTVELAAAGVMPVTERARHEAFLGACLAWRGDFGAALACYERALAAVQGLQRMLLGEERDFIAAFGAALGGDGERAATLLRTAMLSHRQREAASLFLAVPALAARIAALALDYGIEPDHVQALVTRQELQAPRRTLPDWPWPAAVRTLGPVVLSLQGDVIAPSGKSQQRPLALLKSLVAAGPGGRTQQTLLSQLWGEAEVAKSALSVTVHRLRKLLRNDGLVIVAGGRMRFCPERVWTDVAALTELCEEIEALPGTAPTQEIGRLAETLLDLYRGPFCEGSDEAWMLPERERTRKLFLGAVARLGRLLEESGQWNAARDLYHRALDAEPLSELSYRGAMRCAHALEGPAAAFAMYRRCRDTLSILLGLAPAIETERLAITLGLK